MKTIRFSTSNNAVTHLGRNLYSTTPPAIAELVANSYDAYAEDVDINMNSQRIVIADNGKGLNFNEIENKYATIGTEKHEEEPINGLEYRPPMGKKGIGKLAAFSLGNVFKVYSKPKGEDKWIKFKLPYEEMLNTNEYEVSIDFVSDLPNHLSKYEHYDSGFIVEITELRRDVTAATKNKLGLQLSRRFYINQAKTKFKLKIDGLELKLDSNDYYDKMQYLLYFGNVNKQELILKFPKVEEIEEYKENEEIARYFKDEEINGWVGTALKPRYLKTGEGASFANIIVFSNNKIADEDILKDRPSARIANSYIVGEIIADKFIGKLTDPITSSRQGLDDAIPEVEEFVENIEEIRSYVINRWDEIRLKNAVNNLPKRIRENESYQKWLKTLTNDQKKINNKLLDLFSARFDDDVGIDTQAVDSMITAITGVINNIETDELIDEFDKENDEETKQNLMLKLMDNIAKTEDLNHANLIKKRVSAIDELEKLLENKNTPEKLFEKHLSDNPWLINPYWNIDRNNPTETDYLKNQEYFKLKDSDGEFKRNFLDISIRVAEEKYPIIVEIKKNTIDGYSKVNFTMMYDQIKKYRKAMIQNIPELSDVNMNEIKTVFIISEDAGISGSGNKIQLEHNELEMLKNNNIEVLKYNKLLKEARKIYKEHIEYQKKAKLIPDLSN